MAAAATLAEDILEVLAVAALAASAVPALEVSAVAALEVSAVPAPPGSEVSAVASAASVGASEEWDLRAAAQDWEPAPSVPAAEPVRSWEPVHSWAQERTCARPACVAACSAIAPSPTPGSARISGLLASAAAS